MVGKIEKLLNLPKNDKFGKNTKFANKIGKKIKNL